MQQNSKCPPPGNEKLKNHTEWVVSKCYLPCPKPTQSRDPGSRKCRKKFNTRARLSNNTPSICKDGYEPFGPVGNCAKICTDKQIRDVKTRRCRLIANLPENRNNEMKEKRIRRKRVESNPVDKMNGDVAPPPIPSSAPPPVIPPSASSAPPSIPSSAPPPISSAPAPPIPSSPSPRGSRPRKGPDPTTYPENYESFFQGIDPASFPGTLNYDDDIFTPLSSNDNQQYSQFQGSPFSGQTSALPRGSKQSSPLLPAPPGSKQSSPSKNINELQVATALIDQGTNKLNIPKKKKHKKFEIKLGVAPTAQEKMSLQGEDQGPPAFAKLPSPTGEVPPSLGKVPSP